MDKEFIQNLQKQWKAVKESAATDCDNKGLPNLAKAYRECSMFNGTESIEELAKLITSVRGAEFCVRYNFPNIVTLRHFKDERPERYGVYIDERALYLKDPEQSTILLAGRTAATIEITDNSRAYKVILLCGAKAIINARKWSVVHVQASVGSFAVRNPSDNAIIL